MRWTRSLALTVLVAAPVAATYSLLSCTSTKQTLRTDAPRST